MLGDDPRSVDDALATAYDLLTPDAARLFGWGAGDCPECRPKPTAAALVDLPAAEPVPV